MTRYYLEVCYRVAPVDAVDEHTDAMMDALSVQPNLIDADVGADLRHGWTDVCTVVEGEDEAGALRMGLVAIRSAPRQDGKQTSTRSWRPSGPLTSISMTAIYQPSRWANRWPLCGHELPFMTITDQAPATGA